jgi:hypothetical protein
MAYEYSYTGQIPHTCLDLGCLLVKNDGTPLGEPFILRKFEEPFVTQLAESIKGRRSDIPSSVLPDFIKLWKPDPPLSALLPPSGLLSAVNALHLNQEGSERSVTALHKTSRLRRLFTPNQLQEGQINVIAQLPLDRENEEGSDICICAVLRTIQFTGSGLRALFYRQFSSTTYVRVLAHI